MPGYPDQGLPGSGAGFSAHWSSIKARVDAELERSIPNSFEDLAAGEIRTIHKILAGGKRIRGCLVCLVAEALGGKIGNALPRAVAIECIQAASLIHDDYVDEDTRRRNRAATWIIEGPRKVVLLGDLIFAIAIEKMMQIGRQDGLAVARVIATMASGAYREPLNPSDLAHAVAERGDRPELYDAIIHLKTGALFGAASRLGAIAARASAAVRAIAFEWGARVGEAYQIADDLEEVLTLDTRSEISPRTISRLAPLFLWLGKETNFQAVHFSTGGEAAFCEWLKDAQPVLEKRMRHEITNRLDRAAKTLERFPGTSDTRWLRAAPAMIIRISGRRRSQNHRRSGIPCVSP